MEQVRSTGSTVVDRVRSGLSYNDIVVSMDSSMFRTQLANDTKRTAFMNKIFGLMTDGIWNRMRKSTAQVRRCAAFLCF